MTESEYIAWMEKFKSKLKEFCDNHQLDYNSKLNDIKVYDKLCETTPGVSYQIAHCFLAAWLNDGLPDITEFFKETKKDGGDYWMYHHDHTGLLEL